MSFINIKINLKSKRKTIEIEMTENQFQTLMLDIESNSKFLVIGKKLFINKNDIIFIEVEGE